MVSTQSGSDFFLESYLRGDLNSFFRVPPNDIESALKLPSRAVSPSICKALEKTALRHGAPQEVMENIAILRGTEARVVVTGQQPGLLLGPAFSLSKALTAVRLAEELSQPEKPVVPVFWVASQDHDHEEINHTYLLDLDEQLHRVAVDLAQDVPSGRIPMTDRILGEALASLAELKVPDKALAEVTELLESSARASNTYADWFVGQMYRLLGHSGLVLLDPLDIGIAPHFNDVLEAELESPAASIKAIMSAASELRLAGFEPQLGRGVDSTNLFLEELGDLPRRSLLRFDGTMFRFGEQQFSTEALKLVTKESPGRITPAAGLRPITQDAILPNIATVVGPGELRYLAQLRDVYRCHGISMPLIWPRATVTVAEPPVQRILKRYGIDYREIVAGSESVFEEIILKRRGHVTAFTKASDEIEKSFEELITEVSSIEPTLSRPLSRAVRAHDRIVSRLRGKVAHAALMSDTVTNRQFQRLRLHLRPAGQPQERILSGYSYMLKFGVQSYIEALQAVSSKGEVLVKF